MVAFRNSEFEMKFSVIVPVYNVKRYLRQCLDSISAQTETAWECICVDDGSTDGSGLICDEYANRDKRYVVIHQKNKGLPAARNAGIEIARGDYLCFVDGDDAIVKDWLEVAGETIKQGHVDVVRLYLQDWAGGELVEPLPRKGCTLKVIKGEHEILTWGWRTLSQEAWAVLLFINRKKLGPFRFTEKMPIHEDAIFALQLIERIDSFVTLHYPGYLYRKRNDSIMHSYISVTGMLKYWSELRGTILAQKNLLIEYGLWKEVIAIFSRLLYTESRGWALRRNQAESHRFREMPQYLIALEKEGLLDFNAVAWVWRGVFKLYCKTGIYWPMLTLYRIAILGVRYRNWFARRTKCKVIL